MVISNKLLLASAITISMLASNSAKSADVDKIKSITVYGNSSNSNNYRPYYYNGGNQNSGFAIVTKTKSVDFDSGMNRVFINQIPDTADYSSIVIDGLDKNKNIIEQKFSRLSLGLDEIMKNALGKDVEVEQTAGDRTIYNRGRLVSYSPNIVLKQDDDKLRVINGYSSIIVTDDSAKTEDSNEGGQLELLIASGDSSDNIMQYSFETTGVSWDADYRLYLSKSGPVESATLEGWANIFNNTSISAKGVELDLVAGDPNKTQKSNHLKKSARGAPMMAMAESADFARGGGAMQSNNFSEYYVYSLSRLVDVDPLSMKKIKLFEDVNSIPIKRKYIYHSQQNQGVQTEISFVNDDSSSLGFPLPKGNYRVYEKDSKGNAKFVGEATESHKKKKDDIELKVGKAYDIKVDRKQADKKYNSSRRIGGFTTTFEISNSKNESVTIHIKEGIYNNNWRILSSTVPYKKIDVNNIEFPVKVEANSKRLIEYTSEYSW